MIHKVLLSHSMDENTTRVKDNINMYVKHCFGIITIEYFIHLKKSKTWKAISWNIPEMRKKNTERTN